jgi:hypothetical protein
MRIEIITQWHNDSIEDFELKVNKYCSQLEENNKIIIEIQIIEKNNLKAIIKYK